MGGARHRRQHLEPDDEEAKPAGRNGEKGQQGQGQLGHLDLGFQRDQLRALDWAEGAA